MKPVIEDVTNIDTSDTDETLHRILNQRNGDVEDFMRVIYSFLKRKTNFVSSEGADKRMLRVFKEFQASSKGVKTGFLGKKSAVRAPASAPTPPVIVSTDDPALAQKKPPSVTSTGPEPSTSDVVAGAPSGSPSAPPVVSPSQVAAGDDAAADENDEDKGLPPNAGNGLDLETYSWTQTLGDLTIVIPVPTGTRGRDCMVDLKTKHITAGLKGKPILEGPLHADIVIDDCYWNCDGKAIEITLQKQDGMNWWSSVLEGGPKVNTQKVQPENSKLSDLDGETRQTVEKMMFDQRQKALNRPTSDQMKQQDMLKKFMEAHPEMDFSNAKIM